MLWALKWQLLLREGDDDVTSNGCIRVIRKADDKLGITMDSEGSSEEFIWLLYVWLGVLSVSEKPWKRDELYKLPAKFGKQMG